MAPSTTSAAGLDPPASTASTTSSLPASVKGAADEPSIGRREPGARVGGPNDPDVADAHGPDRPEDGPDWPDGPHGAQDGPEHGPEHGPDGPDGPMGQNMGHMEPKMGQNMGHMEPKMGHMGPMQSMHAMMMGWPLVFPPVPPMPPMVPMPAPFPSPCMPGPASSSEATAQPCMEAAEDAERAAKRRRREALRAEHRASDFARIMTGLVMLNRTRAEMLEAASNIITGRSGPSSSALMGTGTSFKMKLLFEVLPQQLQGRSK